MSSNETNAETQTPNALTAAEQKKRELVNFVANNILNGLTLNQTINVIQQVALRDANQIVSDADEEKLAEIEEAFKQAVEQARAAAAEAEAEQSAEAAPQAEKKTAKSTKKKTSGARKKAAAA